MLPPAAAPAAPTVVTCAPTKLKVAVSLLEPSVTESSSFVTVPETHVGFTQGGSSKSCVIVRFSAETFASGPDSAVRVRALLDNTKVAIPAEVTYSAVDNFDRAAHSYEFVFPNVAPGNHTIKMQFRSANSCNCFVVSIGVHTTVVQFEP